MQLKLLALSLAAALLAGCAMVGMNTRYDRMSTSNPMVGGAAMYASKDIIDNAVNKAGGGVSSKKQPSAK